MKIIAFYLPQFHEIPENNELWGEGFTEWTNVKKAVPLFPGHEQPVEPLGDNYYDLTSPDVMKWQVHLAKQYGIYGFCFYHYWYNGHLLMNKPIEHYLQDLSLDLPFCLCWANHEWTMSWVSKEDKVIFKEDYSDRNEWKEHFNYLLPFLKDERYIRTNGKPLIVIYEAYGIDNLKEILCFWKQLSIENGLPGLEFAFQSSNADTIRGYDTSMFDYDIEYQPQYARIFTFSDRKVKSTILNLIRRIDDKWFHSLLSAIKPERKSNTLTIYDYDDIWNRILNMGPMRSNSIPGAFVTMDTTPRRQEKGFVIQGMTPEKLRHYLVKQIIRCRDVYKKDMLFVFAWNEWGECGYMEPDKKWGYGVLEAFRKALEQTKEFPEFK